MLAVLGDQYPAPSSALSGGAMSYQDWDWSQDYYHLVMRQKIVFLSRLLSVSLICFQHYTALLSICTHINLWMSTESRLLRELCKLVSNDYISRNYGINIDFESLLSKNEETQESCCVNKLCWKIPLQYFWKDLRNQQKQWHYIKRFEFQCFLAKLKLNIYIKGFHLLLIRQNHSRWEENWVLAPRCG